MQLTIRTLCLLVAVILFLLYAFGVKLGDVSLLGLGLTVFALSFLLPDTIVGNRR